MYVRNTYKMTHLSGFVLQNIKVSMFFIYTAVKYYIWLPSVSGLKRRVHEEKFPHSPVDSFWRYDAGSEQLKAFKYSRCAIHIESFVVSVASIILANKSLQSPVKISFSYARQVWGHNNRETLVVSLHGGFATRQSACRNNSRQAGGDRVFCPRRFSMI